ncbi:hypothetical protein [Niabella hibiscisoli]|uniref:hypothetical protein n=1 Tax=Niabella hibiscisoli TaxID=1825928 RepID=UPI001F0E349C|nr:hypothetical protein [Niabella hibiscisoli]MCH5715975.1 hypothetical protein [Niabella hibiscisoli]
MEGLLNAQKSAQYQSALLTESAATDPQRFAGLKPVDLTLTTLPEKAKKISDLLVGAFLKILIMPQMGVCMQSWCRTAILNIIRLIKNTGIKTGTTKLPGAWVWELWQ